MMAAERIYLVGPMGAGKSTIGRLLADELGYEFVDLDREIEDRAGVDIPWIFDKEGEEGFRERESIVLASCRERSEVLISTGGGVVGRERNRQVMHDSGVVIYLYTSVAEQVRRTGRDRRRPLLQQGDPAGTLARLMAERDPFYREIAHIIIDTDDRTPRSVALDLKSQLAAFS